MLGIAHHPSLARFDILQELSSEDGRKLLLGRSKGGKLASIELLFEGPVPAEISAALARQSSIAAKLTADTVVQTRALLLEPDLAALVTEFVPGVSLQRLLRFASGRGVRLPDAAGWYIASCMLDGLAHAHAQVDANAPIVHGGVSPSVVVVGWDGGVKLGEFGLERVRAMLAAAKHMPGALAPLMAPEQARGSAVTERTDVFSAALLVWRIATGRTPYARFRERAAERILAMSEGAVAKLGRTRPDLPEAVREAFDRALDPDPAGRTVTTRELATLVRSSFDLVGGRAAMEKLLGRWRDALERSVSSWESHAPPPMDAPTALTGGGATREGTLALSTVDERPSDGALVGDASPEEPWKKDVIPGEEAPLAPTDAAMSLSRVGATAPDALTMPPLPPMRMTMPSLPVYGGPPVNIPRPIPKPFFTGGVAAAFVAAVFAMMIVAAIVLFKWLMGPTPPP